jgi:hypothetical protein
MKQSVAVGKDAPMRFLLNRFDMNLGKISAKSALALIDLALCVLEGCDSCCRREREATYCNSLKLRGMDSALPHFKDSRELLLDA